MKENNYIPNSFARLKAKESNTVGVIVPTLNSKVTSRVVTSVGRYLRSQGYEALIKDSDHSPKLELENINRLFTQKVDGILFSAISLTEEHKQLLMNSPVPVVVLAQNFEEGITVTMDDYTAGKTMGSFMGSRVRGKIAYLGVEEEDEAVGIFRRQGVLEGIKESGSQVMTVETGDYSYVSGQEMMEKVLEKGIPDGVICATDRLAFGAYRILQKHGILIPEQVSVAGFGGYDESELLSPQLTTLRFDSYGLGYLGAETLLKMIREEPVPKNRS